MNNILSGTKHRVSPEGVSLMDETNNLASHLERSPLVHSYGYASTGDRPTCFASLPINSKSFMQHTAILVISRKNLELTLSNIKKYGQFLDLN